MSWRKALDPTHGLLGSDSAVLPWLPDETLFSLCSRHHRLWGYSLASQTAKVLFGGRRIGTHHDFPSGLDEFYERTRGVLGLPVEIASDRTLLRFFRPFLEELEIVAAVQSMRGSSVAHLKFRLGLLTSRFRANHPLKACPQCVESDLEARGWVYWHIQHQYPGVWACPEHDCWLRISTMKSTGVERFMWHLPDDAGLTSVTGTPCQETAAAVSRLARTVVSLIEHASDSGRLQLQRVRPALLQRAAEHDWVTAGGRLRMKQVASAYLDYCRPLRAVPEFAGLPGTLAEAQTQLGRLLHSGPHSTHALRILLAIDWLFGDAAEYLDSASSQVQPGHTASAPATGAAAADTESGSNEERKQQVIALVSAGVSASAAAADVGVAVATAMAWLAAAGIPVRRRAKSLKPKVLRALVKALRAGMDKSKAAEKFDISVPTVTRVLRTVPGLQSEWHTTRFERARSAARAQWLKALEDYPDLGIKLIRANLPATYAWLYRNDRAWLAQHRPARAIRGPDSSSSGVRWDERDDRLSKAVLDAALTLSQSNPGKPLRLWQLYQAVPELKAKLERLNRLPRTRRVIEQALDRPGSCRSLPDLFG